MKFTVDFIFEPKQKIKIKGLDVLGTVVGLYYGETGKQYQVSYFLDGDKKVMYLYEEELEESDGSEKFGFVK